MIEAGGPLVRIGHRGAAALAPENTLASFERALEEGVDWIEFDVLDLDDGTLVLAHSGDLFEVSHGSAQGAVRTLSLDELRVHAPALPTLEEALAFFAARPEVGLHLDLKTYAHSAEIAAALRHHGVEERTFVSSHRPGSLRDLAAHAPGLTLGLTYPEDRRGFAKRRGSAPVIAAAAVAMRAALPLRIGRWLEQAGASVAVLHQALVTRGVVQRCHALGAPVIAWTVDDAARLRHLRDLGVDGVVSNDPRIFGL